ncbi:MAG: hypothetical protein ACNI3A_19555 [Desulfovibrio sp.]|uniref:hypothetical protein n=1 Tax=Desulfovibrio sp. 7SRBS1 TaxID=3378064 RepID=UPI003B3EEE5D
MAKEDVQKSMGVFAAVFAHTGELSKEEAKELSGLDDNAFEEAYAKAALVAKKVQAAESNKVEHFMNHLGEEINEYMDKFFL